MKKNINTKRVLLLVTLFIAFFVYTMEVINILDYPSQININKNSNKELNMVFPFTVKVIDNKENILEFEKKYEEKIKLSIKNNYKIKSLNNGMAKLGINFLGIVPVKQVDLNVVDSIHITPGGEALGVRLNTKGVLVVGMSEIEDENGTKYNPSEDAGIKVGDSLLKIDDVVVKDAAHVIDILNNIKNKKIQVTLSRNGKEFNTHVNPIKSKQDNSYRLGIWVRDKTAGIGTLTFYDQESQKFGALGHSITDSDTGILMDADSGEIMKAQISSIEQGKKGEPGEIRGMFLDSDDTMGKIDSNTTIGIYGEIYNSISKSEPLPIAFQDEIKLGKAHILSTIENDTVERYEIEIIKKDRQRSSKPKSMVIKVVDSRLLEKTGGIVRGMSGSPIIQDGKIVGAVTHVFVNDPTKGYGIYIEWMMEEVGILKK